MKNNIENWNLDSFDWDNTNLINKEKDLDDSSLEDLSHVKFQLNSKKTFEIINSEKDIILPKKETSLRIVTFKSMNASLLLQHIAKQEKIEELLIAAYSINYDSVKLIDSIINANECKTEILISNLRNQAYRKKEELTKEIFIKNKNVKLFFCSSHAKIISVKTKKGNYYHIEGSGNLSFNSRVEQYVIDNDKNLFNFTKEWFKKIRIYLKEKKELVCFGFDENTEITPNE